MASIWLAHVQAYHKPTSTLKTLYWSSGMYISGAADLPPGGAAHIYYEPCIKQPAIMRRDIFDSATTFGAAKIGIGLLELVNLDGHLDEILDYALDGRQATIIFGEVKPDSTTPVWTVVLTAAIEQAEVAWDTVSLRLRDKQFLLDVPLSKNTYAGNNALPLGLEGLDDLKGKRKPVCLGKAFNISPPLVNTSKLIYQVHDGAISSINAVYDRGVVLSAGSVYSSEADMLANDPSAGTYRVWPAGGYFRLGSAPDGQITADVTQSMLSVANALQSIAKDYAGIPAGEIVSADVTALHGKNSSAIGLWVYGGDTTCKQAADEISNSIGAWYGFDRTGLLRMGRIEAPSGTPEFTLAREDIIRIDRTVSNDPGRGIPVWQVALNHSKNYTVQTNDLAGSVSMARRTVLAEPSLSVTAADVSVKTAHLLAAEQTIDTCLVQASDASTEAARRLALYKEQRSVYVVRAVFDSSDIAQLDLGDVVELVLPRYSMDAGQLFIVIGLQPNLKTKLIDLTLWG